MNIFLPPAMLILFIAIGLPPYIRRLSECASPNDYINLLVFSLIMGSIYYTVTLPLAYYSEFALEHKFSLSNQTLESWVKRKIKEVGRQKRIVLCDTLLNNFNEDEKTCGTKPGGYRSRQIL